MHLSYVNDVVSIFDCTCKCKLYADDIKLVIIIIIIIIIMKEFIVRLLQCGHEHNVRGHTVTDAL